MKKLAILFIAIQFLSCACNKNKAENQGNLLNGSWELEYISYSGMQVDGLYPNAKPYIALDVKDNRASGKNGCNNYSGNYTIDGSKINFDEASMITTKMFCDGEGEKAYMGTLAKINSYSVTDEGKTLNFLNGNVVLMRFHKTDK